MLLLKLSGIALIVLSSTLAGYMKSRSLISRSKKLSMILEGTKMLYEYIDQEGCELDKAIKNSFAGCDFLRLENGKFYCEDDDLKKEEKAEIHTFFFDLGSSVKRAECDKIINFRLKIQRLYDIAEKDAAKKCKVYQTFGICIGLAVGILLI